MDDLTVYCIDVGSTESGAFGWARLTRESEEGFQSESGTQIDSLIENLEDDVQVGKPVTLGLECPLYLPVPEDAKDLSSGREGEGARSCFAPAGGYVGFLGLHQLLYILQELKELGCEWSLDWKQWDTDSGTVLLWEAFVSQEAHTEKDEHMDDALTGAAEFIRKWEESSGDPNSDLDLRDEERNLSLAGTALLWAGIMDDLNLLEQELLVVRPEDSHQEMELVINEME